MSETHAGGSEIAEPEPGDVSAPRPLTRRHWLSFVGSWFFLTMGIFGLFRGTMEVLGVSGLCAAEQPVGSIAPVPACPSGPHESLIVGLLLGAGAVAMSFFGAQGFGVPAYRYAGILLFGSQGIALIVAGFRQPGGPSVPILIAGVVCAALVLPALRRSPTKRRHRFLGERRVDGVPRGNGALPARDQSTIWFTWVISVVAGILFASALK